MANAVSTGRDESRPASRTEQILRAFHEEDEFAQTFDTQLLRWLWRFVAPHKALIILSLLAGSITVALALVQPQVIRYIIDEGAVGKDPDAVARGGIALAVFVVFQQAFTFGQAYATQIAGAHAVGELRANIFEFLHGLRLAYFDRTPVGRLVTRVTNDTDALLELFSSGAFKAFTDLLQLVGIVVILLIMDWQLALVAFAAAPPTALIVRAVRMRARGAFRTIRAKTARMNATMNEQVIGMPIVQAFGQQRAAGDEFDDINSAYRDANINSVKYEAIQDAAVDMVQSICGASIIIALGFHQVSVGTLFAFNVYVMLFFEPISALAQRYTLLQRAMTGAERIAGLLETHEPDCRRLPADPDEGSDLAIRFDHVNFEYKPNSPVLNDVSFEVRRGQKVALVGPTGAGKTTVASLALRLYDIQSGTIRVLGKDVCGLERDELRTQFAVVPQDVFLFPGTLASNIAASATPDLQRVERVLQRLGIYDILAGRPDGLNTEIEEQGANFSAGERQLIAFARATYRDAPILILDEATASVDSNTEARFQTALNELLKGRTALIIAHRLSTVRRADKILAFHKGRLVEQGTHEELVEQGGLYAKLHELHFSRQRGSS